MSSVAPNTSLGPYQLLESLGKGGMGTVYRAYQVAMERHVALKILSEELSKNEELVMPSGAKMFSCMYASKLCPETLAITSPRTSIPSVE